jgi:hypothetical protein
MGRVRRNGFIMEWFIGDHPPRHVHVFNAKGEFLGRLGVEHLTPVEKWKPSRKLLQTVQQLKDEKKI